MRFTASLPFDRRLAKQDLQGSAAQVAMLAECGIIRPEEAEQIRQGLAQIGAEISAGTFPFDLSFEDIHMNIEKRLVELVGPAGGKLHTARSRNDQVALDLHLYVMEESVKLERQLRDLQAVFLAIAREHEQVVLPGYTHLQRAQPVLFAHHMLAYFWMLQRDRERLHDLYRRTDLMPLGAGAIAGTGFPIDREQVARQLGFSRLYENSMDAVSDRDYLVEFLSFASLLMMHLSRLSEELILWSSAEFGFIELDDAYTTGSSMMPQKKNPDVAELARGKTGRVYGSLFDLLTVLKVLPLTYNKDLQEDKEGLFDTVDTLQELLPLYGEMLRSMQVNGERMAAALAGDDSACATDLAVFLVGRGLPFREAHHIVGKMIAYCRREGLRLKELNAGRRAAFHSALAEDVSAILDPLQVVEARRSRGGTATAAVREQLRLAEAALEVEWHKGEGQGDGSPVPPGDE